MGTHARIAKIVSSGTVPDAQWRKILSKLNPIPFHTTRAHGAKKLNAMVSELNMIAE